MAQNTNGNGNNAEERQEAYLGLDEHYEFNSITESIMIKSSDFLQLVANVFKMTFADFEGCRVDPDPTTNLPTITLVFNHLEKPNTDLVYACTKDVDTKTQNDTVRRLRNFTNRLYNGDTYRLTDEGKDMLKQFIMNIPRTRDKQGNIRWNDIIMTVADDTNMRNQQFTSLSFLDINLMAKFLFGPETENGNHWIYTSRVMRSVPGAMSHIQGQVMHREFVLEIKRIRDEEVTELGRKLGFGVNANGLDIVRAAF